MNSNAIINVKEEKDRYRQTSYKVYYGEQAIGYIKHDRYGDETQCIAYAYYNKGEADFLNRFKTLYQAKIAIVKEYEKGNWKGNDTKKDYIKNLPYDTDAEFYPTPEYFMGRMLAGVDWGKVYSVLEPSAGKGDLCTGIHKVYSKKNRSREDVDIDCIESDPNLQHILIGKGLKLVHDNFLTFHTYKHYDLIVMNPPFSRGAEHLLKAISLQEAGGQIVCLLNSETIKNPYTNQRKLLMEQLKKYHAKISFISHSFKNAERKTDVEVAIVYINISEKPKNSFIFNDLQKAAERKYETEMPHMLASSEYFDYMIGRYNFEMEGTVKLIEEYKAMCPYILDSLDENDRYKKPILKLEVCGKSDLDINTYLQKVRMKYWSELFRNDELMSKFTSKLHRDFQNIVDSLKDYDFTKFNIQKVFCQMNCELINGVKEAIEELFEKMTSKHTYYPECEKNIHYYTGWKTNKAHCIGKKVILPVNGFSSYSFHREPLDLYHCYSVLSDIERSFNYLDGCMTEEVSLHRALECANKIGQTKNIRCKYFDVTFYKKGTVHIIFTNERVVDALNIYMGKDKNWLPPHYGKTRYNDLDPDTKRTVDEFQGKEKYEAICDNPEAYIIEINDNTPMLALPSI